MASPSDGLEPSDGATESADGLGLETVRRRLGVCVRGDAAVQRALVPRLGERGAGIRLVAISAGTDRRLNATLRAPTPVR